MTLYTPEPCYDASSVRGLKETKTKNKVFFLSLLGQGILGALAYSLTKEGEGGYTP